MIEVRRRPRTFAAATLALVALLASGSARAETFWATSPVVSLPAPRYSVYGPTPGCEGQVLVDSAIRRSLGRVGIPSVDPETNEPFRLARTIGEALNVVGMGTLLQTNAVCAEVCALLPLDASRVVSVIGYVTSVGTDAFVPQPFGHTGDFVRWMSGLDTTRRTADGRLACAEVRSWSGERKVFLVVGYER
jgi:hypothetical protein